MAAPPGYNKTFPLEAINAVACSSPTTCMAVGGTNAVSTTNGGTTWTVRVLGSATLSAVSCPSTTECVAAVRAARCLWLRLREHLHHNERRPVLVDHDDPLLRSGGDRLPDRVARVLVGTHGNGASTGRSSAPPTPDRRGGPATC